MDYRVIITTEDDKKFMSIDFYNEHIANKECLKWNKLKGLKARVEPISKEKGGKSNK